MNQLQKLPWGRLLVAGVVLALLVLLGWQVLGGSKAVSVGESVPDFSLTPFNTAQPTFRLSDWHGKVVVLNFWASWCVPCRAEAAELESFWQAQQTNDVLLIGLAYTDLESESRAFLQKYQLSYPNAPDIGNSVSRFFHIQGVPETYIIGRDGRLAQKVIGPTTAAQLTAIVAPLLEQP
jgi:cytochrome c biogenesis protein CcmG/thiol:disulfide interchange protein DsbE